MPIPGALPRCGVTFDESCMEPAARKTVAQHAGMLFCILDQLQAQERSAMRALIILSSMAIIFSSTACEAGMTTGPHKVLTTTSSSRHATVGHRHERGRVHYARGIGRPIAAVGNAIGSTLGGIFR
jgi:hypothetical protein